MDGRAQAFRLSWPRRRVRGRPRVMAVMSLSERRRDRLIERKEQRSESESLGSKGR